MSEVQVTDQDRDRAEQLRLDVLNAADYMPCPYNDPHNGSKEAAFKEVIAFALAQARDAGHKAAYAELTKSDTPIDISPPRWLNGKRCAPEWCILTSHGDIAQIVCVTYAGRAAAPGKLYDGEPMQDIRIVYVKQAAESAREVASE